MRYRPVGAAALRRDYILISGVGRVIVPFIRTKLINLTLIGLGKA